MRTNIQAKEKQFDAVIVFREIKERLATDISKMDARQIEEYLSKRTRQKTS